MIKAEGTGNGVGVSITGSEMADIMNEFSAIVGAMIQLLSEGAPKELALMGIYTATLTGMAKALGQLEDDEEYSEEDTMAMLREAMKREHEGE